MARQRFNSGNKAAEELPKAKFNKENIRKARRILQYLAPYKAMFITGLGLLVVGSLLSLGFPFLMGKLIDAAMNKTEGGMFTDINTIAISLLAILLGQAIISFFRIYLFVQVGERSLADLRLDTFHRIIRLPMDFLPNAGWGVEQPHFGRFIADTGYHDDYFGRIDQASGGFGGWYCIIGLYLGATDHFYVVGFPGFGGGSGGFWSGDT